jgi:endo-1,4-beta-xylanase
MRTRFLLIGAAGASLVLAISSCKKIDMGAKSKPDFSVDENSMALKDATDVPIGTAVDYGPMTTNASYEAVVKRDFDMVTFGYQMKHGAIVKDNGTLDYTNTDALVAKVGALGIHGHTLGWHANQNATYLKNFAGIVVPAAAELATNPGFESGGLANWSTFNNQNGSTVTATTAASEIRTGTTAMKVDAKVGEPTNQWKVQVAGALFNTTPGTQYQVSYWVKAANTGGSIRLSTQTAPTNTAAYQGDQSIGTAFQQVSWTFTAATGATQTRVLFDMGAAVNVYFIDDVSIKEVIPAPSGGQIAAKLDIALGDFITNTVNRYKNKVKSWDVVNELFDDNGNIRNNSNTSPAPADVLVWSNYLGRDYALKAFNYAKAADPTADLYINDYNLEASNAKLDSLIKYVAELKTKGAKVDGIGTQMHLSWNSSYTGIVNMFKKLAATGLKIKITELDVRVNTNGLSVYTLSPEFAGYQASMYNFAISSYLTLVPKAQQAGITIWGISDDLSWLYNGGKDYPLMYDKNFKKKPAYTGVLNALQGK